MVFKKEEFLFRKPLGTTTRGVDSFHIADEHFQQKGSDWENRCRIQIGTIDVCTEGAKAVVERHSYFHAQIRRMHCAIHREVSASKKIAT